MLLANPRTMTPVPSDTLNEIREVAELAAELPRFTMEDLTEEEQSERLGAYRKWCNNFHQLFLGLRNAELYPDLPISPYLQSARTLGEAWDRFVQEQKVLISQIIEAFEYYEVIQRIRKLEIEILRQSGGDIKALEALDTAIDPELGTDAVLMPFWKKLDCLLRQVYDAMKAAGIDPSQFDG